MINHIQRKRRRNPSEIQELLNRYRQSQVSQVEFVRGEGICVATLRNYINGEGGLSAGVSRPFIEVERAESADIGRRRATTIN